MFVMEAGIVFTIYLGIGSEVNLIWKGECGLGPVCPDVMRQCPVLRAPVRTNSDIKVMSLVKVGRYLSDGFLSS